MALVKCVRDFPEVEGGKCTADIPEESLENAVANGWRVADKKETKVEKVEKPAEPKVEEKEEKVVKPVKKADKF